MGWTSYAATRYKRNGEVDRKAECDKLFTEEQFEILKSAMVGSVYYAAIRTKRQCIDYDINSALCLYKDIPVEEQKVWGAVVLTSVEYGEFWYKDMSEDVGPYESKCPISILRLLSPTDNEYALAWRERCQKYNDAQKEKRKNPQSLSNLPIGAVIKFPWNGKFARVVKRAPNRQFKRTWWHNVENNTYIPQKYISENYEVVSA